MMEYEKIERRIEERSLDGFRYSINNISKIISIPIILLIIYLSVKSIIVFSIVVGLYLSEIILYKILKDSPKTILEISHLVSINTNTIPDMNIVIDNSKNARSSMIIGKSNNGIDRAIIYITEIKPVFKLNMLGDLKAVYHLLVYFNIISLASHKKFGYNDARESITMIKIFSLIYTLSYIPKLYFKPSYNTIR